MSELNGWNPVSYRLWYLTGAILAATYLGQGTIFLMAEKRLAKLILIALLLASIAAGILVFTAPVDLNSALAGGLISGKGMPSHVRLLTPFFNIFGTVALVGGALKSHLNLVWNGGSKPRAGGTALIAVGALVVAFGGTLSRFSMPGSLYITELVGISLIFSGYLSDAPYLEHHRVKAIVLVQKQFDLPENYLLYNLTENTKIEWSSNSNNQAQLRLQFDELALGKYMLVAPNDSMYGGVTFHFFGIN